MKQFGNDPARRRIVTRFLLLTCLFAAGLSSSAHAVTRIPVNDKTEIFERVWNLINERYYDPKLNGVDWPAVKTSYKILIQNTETDREFYDVMKRMVGELNDAHTRLLTPREAREDREKRVTTAGILISRVDGQTVIEKVLSTGSAELSKVKPGMIVISVDGVPIDERFQSASKEVGKSSSERALEILAYSRVLRGDPGTIVRVGLENESGRRFEVNLTREVVDQTSVAKAARLPSGTGYISVNSFKTPIADQFRNSLIKLKDAPALIVDLRYNGGGSINEVLKMAGYFLNKRRLFGSFVRRSKDSEQSLKSFWAGEDGDQIYSGPVVVLTNRYSASGSELFASGLQESGRATVIGTRSCGCLLGVSRKHRLKDGSELHISDVGFVSAKGRVYEKLGVTPDSIVSPRLDDLRKGFDREIAEAESLFASVQR